MAKKKEREYSNRSKAKGKASAVERRKTIGKHLNFGAAEAYKLLRTNLVFSMADETTCKVIGVTSALSGEGKSTTSINLAYTLAQSGKHVLLLEADMRIPVLASTLQLKNVYGLSNVLAGISSLNEVIHQNVLIRNMSVLPAGEIPPNPSELLSSKRMELVLEALVTKFDYIIIDLPPINAVSDGLAVSKLLSGMIVVVRQDYCDQYLLAEAMRRMELLKVKILGFVMNGAETTEKRYKKHLRKYSKNSKYGYGYSYGHDRKSRKMADAVNMDGMSPVYEPETVQKNE
ncbi:MAG: tyrosine-protein kinase family protein [Clostridia bacterium]|nr:tyrosine-protein kinase family protein [Clostridia bacterium]